MNLSLRTLVRRALMAAVSVGSTLSLFATDYFATPAGAGAQDGSSWTDAYPQSLIQTAVNALQPGDTLNVGSGTYTLGGLSITGSGTAGSYKTILGVDTGGGRPLFQGNFNVANDANGARFIYVPGAAHYWAFKNLAFKNYGWAISLALSSSGNDTLRSNFLFEDLSFDTIEDAIRLYNINNVEVTNCTAIRYTKKAFRFGDHTSFITFSNCLADCTGGATDWEAKAIPVGFGGDDTAQAPIIHDITLIDCVARNHWYPQGSTNYWQGDGFSSERGTYNLSYIRCKGFDNRDAGFDNKASNVLYQDCVSVGNSRGYRHWGDGGRMINCVAAYNLKWGGIGTSYGVWVSSNGGGLTVDFSTLHHSAFAVYAESGATVTVNDSILSSDSAGGSLISGPIVLNNSVEYRPGTGIDPAYVAADPVWRGEPFNAMDSETYGLTKGYNSGRVDETPNLPPTLGIAADPLSGTAPLTVNFVASAADTDGFIVGYLWNFGDGRTATIANPTITYSGPGTFTAICTVTDNRGAQASDSVVITAGVPATPVESRIESGSTSAYIDTLGRTWTADYGFGSGGGIADRGAIEIAGTDYDRLYQTERWGVSSYSLLVANGTYNIRLHFAETYTGTTAAGQRVFSVTAEGAAPAGWTNIDVFAETGGRNIALVKSGVVTVTDNYIDLAFAASVDSAMINAIEILPVTGGDLPPAAPTGLGTDDVTTNSFTLFWSPASDDVGVTGYEVFRNGALIGTTSGTSFSVTGLSPYTSYNMTVRARDTAGNGSVLSAVCVGKTLNDGSVGGEIILDNTALFGVTFTGIWPTSTYNAGYYGTNYAHDNNGAKGTKSARFTPDFPEAGTYTVYLWWPADNNRASNVPVDITHAGGTTTVVVNQRTNGGAWFSLGTYAMEAGTANNVLIRTTATNGFVIADAVRFLRDAPDTVAPSAPVGLAASNVTTSSFTLNWSASTDNIGVTGYEVFRDEVSIATPSGTTASLTGLSPNTTYGITVRARDAAGNWSALSVPLSVTTAAPPETVAPSVPDGLVASNVTATSFILSWTASTDNVGVTGYEVFRDGVSIATPTGASASIAGLSPSTTYAMTVRARDAAGNWSDASAPLSVTTSTQSGGGENGRVISLNVSDGATNSLASEEIAGAVPASNWINSTANNQTFTNVADNTGAATTADVAFNNTAFGYTNNTTGTTPDIRMMRSQRAVSNGSTMSATTTQVPFASYDVLVYWGGRTPQETVPATMTVNFQLWNGTSWVTSETKYIRDNNRTWDGTYNESVATAAADAVDGNEYVAFRNVAAERFRVSVTTGNRTGLCGFQIVERIAPVQSAPVITSALSANGNYGAPFSYAIAATGSPSSFSASGLPAGLVIDSTTGVISGTPAATGSFTVTLDATNADGIGTAPLYLTIAPATQTITFPNPGLKTFGDAPFALEATASSGLPVVYAVTSGSATLSENTVTLDGAGSVTISATQPGNANIAPADPVSIAFEVAKAAQTLTFPNPGAKTFGDSPFALGATASSGLSVSYAVASGPASVDDNTITLTGAGSVTLVASQTGDANTMAAEPVSVSFDVSKASAPLVLSGFWQLYDGQPKSVAAITTPVDLAVTLTYNGSSTSPTYPGIYDVVATIDNANYTGTTNGTLVIAAAATMRHAPVLNGLTQASVQVLSAEPITLNGGSFVTGDLLAPGTPAVQQNGQPAFAGTIDGPGAVEPTSYGVMLNGDISLRHIVRRIDAVTLPIVAAPPAPAGTRDLVVNNTNQDTGDFATLRNLTLNGGAGARAIPPGTYGAFIANGGSGFVLGVAGATEPAVYHLQSLTLNGSSARLELAGPVVLTLANGLTLDGTVGTAGTPELLLLRIASGGVTLNSGAALRAFVDAPNGTITINNSATLSGGVTADRLIVNSGGVLVEPSP